MPAMETIYDALVIGARIGFVAASMLFLVQLWRRGRRPTVRFGFTAHGVISTATTLAFTAILVHQAYWQLAGFRNPKFVTFMNRYSRRVAGASESMVRGRILDCNGLVLAETVNGERRYPHGAAVAHAVGYADAKYGKAGVERADDALLRGAAVRGDLASLGRFGRNLVNHRLVAGHDSVLSIDARLQAEAARLFGQYRGAVVGIDPRDGAIRLLYSAPSFAPDVLEASLQADARPLFNRALQGLYPPGSTFKALVAAVALEYRMGGPLDCPAEGVAADPGARPIRDHEYYTFQREGKTWKGHGTIDIREGLARSSNVYFAKLGLLLGADRLNEVADRFALGQSFDVFVGTSGTLGTEASRVPRLSADEHRAIAQVSFGQGELVTTPLHMVSAVGAIAQGGLLYRPYLGEEMPVELVCHAVSARAAGLLGEYLEGVVTSGTGRGARIPGVRLAGKTGTAQTPSGEDHGWFVAYGPVEAPALVIGVVVENSGYGSKRSVPIVRELFVKAHEMGLLTRVAKQAEISR